MWRNTPWIFDRFLVLGSPSHTTHVFHSSLFPTHIWAVRPIPKPLGRVFAPSCTVVLFGPIWQRASSLQKTNHVIVCCAVGVTRNMAERSGAVIGWERVCVWLTPPQWLHALPFTDSLKVVKAALFNGVRLSGGELGATDRTLQWHCIYSQGWWDWADTTAVWPTHAVIPPWTCSEQCDASKECYEHMQNIYLPQHLKCRSLIVYKIIIFLFEFYSFSMLHWCCKHARKESCAASKESYEHFSLSTHWNVTV